MMEGKLRISRKISRLIRIFGSTRVEEMLHLYTSQGKPDIEIGAYLKLALAKSFKPIHALKVDRCPVCNSLAAEIIGSYIYYSQFINLKQCNHCGLGYADIQLNNETFISHFEVTYKDEEYFVARAKSYRQILCIIKKQRCNGRLLDVGCAKGHFLQMALDAGFDGLGCDISSQATNYCRERGLDVRQSEVRDIDYPDGSFDIVTCLDTLYCSRNLTADLLKIVALLKHGGILCLRIPNRNLRWLRNFSKMVTTLRVLPKYRNLLFYNPEHYYVFEVDFLKEWLKNLGLDVVVIESALPSGYGVQKIIGSALYHMGKISMHILDNPIPFVPNAFVCAFKKL